MEHLPADFANAIGRVIEPGKEAVVAKVIEAATLLDDEELRIFLEKFARRVRASPKPVTPQELVQFLNEATSGGDASAT